MLSTNRYKGTYFEKLIGTYCGEFWGEHPLSLSKVAADENWKSWDPPTVRVLNFHKIFRMKK